MKKVLSFILLFGALPLTTYSQVEWHTHDLKVCSYFDQANSESEFLPMRERLTRGQKEIKKFFKEDFSTKFSVYLFPDRKTLDMQWQKDWGVPDFQSECWMVASGIATRLDILSPGVWKEQSCEHDPNDMNETQRLITHEMVHVFHGQLSPHPDFSGMDEIGWFVEGLATYVSGQLTAERLTNLNKDLAAGKAPTQLEDFWKGPQKYGQSGSMVRFIDEKFGRSVLLLLLRVSTEKEILGILKMSEPALISEWRKSLEK